MHLCLLQYQTLDEYLLKLVAAVAPAHVMQDEMSIAKLSPPLHKIIQVHMAVGPGSVF